MKKAVVLLSGGLDSATVLAYAKNSFDCYCLSIAYGQKHVLELNAAKKIAELNQVAEHKIIDYDMRWIGKNALTSQEIPVPKNQLNVDVPDTYVPARNIVMLSLALAWAEALNCSDIFIGVNAVDFSGYPDCTPQFIAAFQNMASVSTVTGKAQGININAPLLSLSKAEIIKLGTSLGVDYSLTTSCYDPNPEGEACGACDACRLRHQGFLEAKIPDPTVYSK